MPDMALMVTDVLVAFDHLRHEATILANVFAEDDVDEAYAEAAAAIAEVRERLAGPVPRVAARRREPPRVRVEHRRRGLRRRGRAVQGVHPRRRRLPGRPEPALERRAPVERVLDLPRPAHGQPVARTCTSSTSRTSRSPARRPSRWSRSSGRARRAAPDRRHPAARRHRRRGPRARRGAARRREGARRARDARRPRPQRPRPRLRVRHGQGRRADGRRDLLARHAHRLVGVGHAARRRDGDGRAARLAAGRDAVRRAEGPRDADHRRARADAARAVRRRRSATCPTAATSTPASTSARPSSRTAACTSRPAAASSPTPTPATRCARPRPRPAPSSRRSSWPAAGGLGMSVARRRQLRLVHLQPRPVPGRAWRGARTSCATTSATVDELLSAGPTG